MNRISGKRALVTGAEGFIGSHLVEALLERGASVRAMVCYNSFGHCGWLDTFPTEKLAALEICAADVRDAGQVTRACEGIDVVFHLAALIGIPYSYVAPESYVATNVQGTLNVLEAVRRQGVSRLVHTSTSEVYGTAQFVPITESHPIAAQSPYAASKVAADQLAYSYFCSFQTPVAIARPFNAFGPRQSTRAIIPTIIAQLASGARTLKLGSLTPTRDFTYVKDTAQGMIAIAEHDEALGEVVNLGSNREISIGALAELLAKEMGVTVELEADDSRMRPERSEVRRLWADNAKAKRLLEWAPAHGDAEGFASALAETIAWFREPANLSRYSPGRYQV